MVNSRRGRRMSQISAGPGPDSRTAAAEKPCNQAGSGRLRRAPLVLGSEGARLMSGGHAGGVGMPPAIDVALRSDHHVLAHGVQVEAAKGTAIGRRAPTV